MPLYEYKCESCGAVYERLRSHAHRLDPMICECGEDATYIISAFAGWASRTDPYADFGSPQYAEHRRKQCGVDN